MHRHLVLRVVAWQLVFAVSALAHSAGSTAGASSWNGASSTVPTAPGTRLEVTPLPPPEVPGGLVRRIEAPKSSVIFQYDSGVPEEWLQMVAEMISVGQIEMGDSGPLVYHTYSSPELFVPIYAKYLRISEEEMRSRLPTQRSSGELGQLWQYYPNVSVPPPAFQFYNPRVVILHEYFHTLQSWLSQRLDSIPTWLVEGSADYFSFRIASDQGLVLTSRNATFDGERADRVTFAKTRQPLSTYESAFGNYDAYATGFLATDYLVDNYGSTKSIQDIWVALKDRPRDWKRAFSKIYGISVDQFYAEFEAYRWQIANVAPLPVQRLAGADRVETANRISQAAYGDSSAQVAVLVRKDNFADALPGGRLAEERRGPVLMTDSRNLEGATEAELIRVLPKGRNVYVLGGEQALSASVAERVGAIGYNMIRLAGADRYATAVVIARDGLGSSHQAVIEADGLTSFGDALCAGAAAASKGMALLLTSGIQQPEVNSTFIAANPQLPRYAVGVAAATADPAASSLAGADEFEDCVLVARRFYPANVSNLGLARVDDFADALGASYFMARKGPVVLTQSTSLPAKTAAYISSTRTGNAGVSLTIFGGTAAISSAISNRAATTPAS